jgi:hypothetical protein
VATSGDCVACPDGTKCAADGGSSQEYLRVQAGYWRISAHSVDIRDCLYGALGCLGDNATMASDLMLGGANGSWVWARRLRAAKRRRLLAAAGDIYGDAYCAEGYMGPLCAVCDPNGYYLDVSGDAPVGVSLVRESRARPCWPRTLPGWLPFLLPEQNRADLCLLWGGSLSLLYPSCLSLSLSLAFTHKHACLSLFLFVATARSFATYAQKRPA